MKWKCVPDQQSAHGQKRAAVLVPLEKRGGEKLNLPARATQPPVRT